MKKFIASLRVLATIFSTLSVVFGLYSFLSDMDYHLGIKHIIQEFTVPSFFLSLYLVVLLFIWTTGRSNEKTHR